MTFEGSQVELRSLSSAQLHHLLVASRAAGREGLVAAAEAELKARRAPMRTPPPGPWAYDDGEAELDAIEHRGHLADDGARGAQGAERPPGADRLMVGVYGADGVGSE